jgi:branched-chain amino acid transport system permease protein
LSNFIQLVVSGVAIGSIYALAALGFTLLWQASATINFAQGEFVMLPTFAMLFLMTTAALPLWAAFVLTALLSAAVLGVGFKRVVVDPLLKFGAIPLIIATLGLSIGFKTIIRAGVSAEAQQFPSPFPVGQFDIAGLNVSYADIGTLLFAGAIVLALQAFLSRTVTGRAMQAVAQNTDAARVLGINVKRMTLYVFVINAILGVVVALLAAPIYLAKFDMGESLGLKAFFAAIIGGFSQTRGALLGGVLLGVLENVVGYYVSPAYKEAVALVLFLVVILFKPEGLLGRPEERKI